MNLDFSDKKILVIGDVMLDVDEFFLTKGISPEAPVLDLLRIGEVERHLGGASNVAANLQSLGVQTTLLGMIGDDQNASYFLELLKKSGIKGEIIKDIGRPTTTKTRNWASSKSHPLYQVSRISEESAIQIQHSLEEKVIGQFEFHFTDIDALIISDYNKGFLSYNIIRSIKELLYAKSVPVVVDTKPERFQEYNQPEFNWFTPNIKEVEGLTGLKYTSPGDKSALEAIGVSLFEKLNPKYVLFTLGDDGMVLYTSPINFEYIPAIKVENADVSGAGDTVNAALAACLSTGHSPLNSARIANYAASIVVGKRGTATCSIDELIGAIKNEK